MKSISLALAALVLIFATAAESRDQAKFKAFQDLQQAQGIAQSLDPFVAQSIQGMKARNPNIDERAIKEFETGLRKIMQESQDKAADFFTERMTLDEIKKLIAIQNDPVIQKQKTLAIEYSKITANSLQDTIQKTSTLMQDILKKYPPKKN